MQWPSKIEKEDTFITIRWFVLQSFSRRNTSYLPENAIFAIYFYDMVGRANEMFLIENSLQYLIRSNAWFIASTWSLSKATKIDVYLISVPLPKLQSLYRANKIKLKT